MALFYLVELGGNRLARQNSFDEDHEPVVPGEAKASVNNLANLEIEAVAH